VLPLLLLLGCCRRCLGYGCCWDCCCRHGADAIARAPSGRRRLVSSLPPRHTHTPPPPPHTPPGKTTLLRHLASHEIKGIPATCQVLHVEQEVVGDDTQVLQAVLQCDVERSQLLAEEQELLNRWGLGW
jgi:hypothetical protein